MSKTYVAINFEKANADSFKIAAQYFGCSYTHLMGMLLKLAKLNTEYTTTPGEPSTSMFTRHISIEQSRELQARLRRGL